MEQNENFLKKAYNKALLPCILSILSGNINILMDGILVARRLGTDALAAISLSLPVYLVLCIAGSFIVSGTAICAAEAIGKNQEEKAGVLYHMAIFWCVLVSVVITAAGLVFLHPICSFLCPDSKVLLFVRAYAGVTIAGALPKILIYIPFWFLRLDGRNSHVTVMMLVMGIGNVLLDFLFLYVFDKGVAGAAAASVFSTAAACVMGFVWLCDSKSSFSFGLCVFCDKKTWINIAKAGSPSAGNNLFQTLRVSVINALLLQYMGSEMVAAFTAVNCIAAFEESVTQGVPQAASAMLGIYSGEHDNRSAKILMARQMKSGIACSLVFGTGIIWGSGFISGAYGLEMSLRPAFIWMALGMVPALFNCVLSGYYNVSGRAVWADGIIFCRVFLMSCTSLYVLLLSGKNPWQFLFYGEFLTIAVWFAVTGMYQGKHSSCSRFLLMDNTLEESGKVLNFSVNGDMESICDASERITGFCTDNGMLPRQTMRISLAMEETMTLITAENGQDSVEFDLRAYSLQGMIGIRIRYSGKAWNPFEHADEEDEKYIGICMIRNMAEQVVYQRTFGMNTVQIFMEGRGNIT